MISNQTLQSTIDGLHAITKTDYAVLDTEASVMASTFTELPDIKDAAVAFANSEADSQTAKGCQFFKVIDDGHLEFIVVCAGDDNQSQILGKCASFSIHELMVAYKERFDKDNFIKNLLLDNLLLVDIYTRSKKLHIDANAKRIVMMLETPGEKDGDEIDRVRAIFSGRRNDFVTAVDERNVIVVKELSEKESYGDVDKLAQVILDSFSDKSGEYRVSYGTIVNEVKDVSRSYKEAMLALDVGRIFFEDSRVIAYSALGIGRLIYQLPIPLCKMFISEIFGGKSPDDFDEETITTINKFFENSLNVSETSRQLFIHRNTLVYRLDKLQKSTGLDLRVFEDAITFKIALMVVKYMKYMEEQRF